MDTALVVAWVAAAIVGTSVLAAAAAAVHPWLALLAVFGIAGVVVAAI